MKSFGVNINLESNITLDKMYDDSIIDTTKNFNDEMVKNNGTSNITNIGNSNVNSEVMDFGENINRYKSTSMNINPNSNIGNSAASTNQNVGNTVSMQKNSMGNATPNTNNTATVSSTNSAGINAGAINSNQASNSGIGNGTTTNNTATSLIGDLGAEGQGKESNNETAVSERKGTATGMVGSGANSANMNGDMSQLNTEMVSSDISSNSEIIDEHLTEMNTVVETNIDDKFDQYIYTETLSKKMEEELLLLVGGEISLASENILNDDPNVLEEIGSFLNDTKAYIGNKVNSLWNKVSNWWKDTTESVSNWAEEVGTNMSNGVQSLWSDVTDWWDDVESWWNADALPSIKAATTVVFNTLESVGATIVTFAQSLVEGLGQFGEAVVDFLALVGTAISSVVTGLYDGGQAIYGAITGNEWTSKTKEMWETTMGFVSKEYVSGWFDYLYENTDYGRWLSENAYGFDTVRSLGSGIGYIAGVVALTVATFGVGGVVASGGTLTASAATAATSAAQMGIIAGAAGIGRGTQNAWADGAGLIEGLASGTLTGIWEGLQFYVGAKISSLQMFGAKGVFKAISPSEIGTKLLNSIARVILDGADGGIEGIVMPVINSIYKDGYYDEFGNYIEFTKDQNIFERYSELFDDNGGWANVITQATIGTATSILGEGFDLRKYFKNTNKSKVANINVDSLLSLNKEELTIKLKKLNIDTLVDIVKNMDDISNLKYFLNNIDESKLINIIYDLDDININKVINNIDENQLILLLSNKKMSKETYRSVVNALTIDQVIQVGKYIRGFAETIDVQLINGGPPIIVSTSWLLNIINDDSKFVDFYVFFDESSDLFGGLTQDQISNGFKKIADIMKKNKYQFAFDPMKQLRFDNIIKNFYISLRVKELNAWADTVMTNNFRKVLSGYVSEEQLLGLKGTYRFMEKNEFELVYKGNATNVMAFNDGSQSVMNLDYSDEILKNNISHESLHQLSYKPGYKLPTGYIGPRYGLRQKIYDSSGQYILKYVGLNETVTEWLNELAMGDDYIKSYYCAYQPAVERLKQILDMNIDGINVDTIKEAYFSGDIFSIASAIDKKVAIPNFFEDMLAPAFDFAIKGDIVKLDELIISLKIMIS